MVRNGRSMRFLFATLASLLLYGLWMFASHSTQIHIPLKHVDERLEERMLKLYLTDSECSLYFPHAFDEIEVAKSRGYIGKAPQHDDAHGYVRARIYHGVLYILNRGSDVWHRQFAILSQIHRAILTAPSVSDIPNIEFTIVVNDHPASNVWSLASHAAPTVENREINNTWLMPDYGFWSWPEPHIGTVDEVKEKVEAVEKNLTWEDKVSKAVWRGTVHWNSSLRGQLVAATQGKAWSDVQELDWNRNTLSMEEFCRYKYLIYTEGVTYSGRLRYFQLCRSVIISPPLLWHTHLSPMLRVDGPEQNTILVKEDWSNLEEVIGYLEANPLEAERIANNNIKTFKDKYLAPAMEVCYWRKLFRAWAEVTDSVGLIPLDDRGTRWESFMLIGKLGWEKTA